ncbi:uncharacterized protein [Lepeophtheirus salmonis]|uniref:uncharacterized protein n=1 Tax=Lepeophtheirus salmonis TaxID=72036 RepID=UPI001AE41F83|nr:general transcriptional corepressor trfA-like [Lepeophtheirus salmonis]XP_040582319.1 general transcriptional corepressor trfA-like [Lepeophtheirus salmonis]
MSYKKLTLEDRRKVLETQPEVKWISIIDNNDDFSESRKHLIRMNQTKSMDNLLTDLTTSLRPKWGAVRNIYTPYGGTKVTALDQLEPKKLYAFGGSKFKQTNHDSRSKRGSWSNGTSRKFSSPENYSSQRNSVESDSLKHLKKKYQGHKIKTLSPDDNYDEYFRNIYERNRKLVTKNRRPLYESKNSTLKRIPYKRMHQVNNDNDSNLEISKSLNDLSSKTESNYDRDNLGSPSPRSNDNRSKFSPSPPHNESYANKEEDQMSIRSRESVLMARMNTMKNEKESAGSTRYIRNHDGGTFVNNSAKNSRQGSAQESLHSNHGSETRIHSNTSIRHYNDATSRHSPPPYDERKSNEEDRRKKTPTESRNDSGTNSQYERVLSRLSEISTKTKNDLNDSKNEGGKN